MYQIGETTYYTCVETAKFVRLALRESFSGVRFSVTCDISAQTAGISIRYMGGPDAQDVRAAVDHFQGTYWNHEYDCRCDRFVTIDGIKTHYGVNHFNVLRNSMIDGSILTVNPLQIKG